MGYGAFDFYYFNFVIIFFMGRRGEKGVSTTFNGVTRDGTKGGWVRLRATQSQIRSVFLNRQANSAGHLQTPLVRLEDGMGQRSALLRASTGNDCRNAAHRYGDLLCHA